MLQKGQGNIFTHRKGADQSPTLKRKAHLFADCRELSRFEAFPRSVPLTRISPSEVFEAHDGPEESALAGAGTAQDDDRFTVMNIEIESMQWISRSP